MSSYDEWKLRTPEEDREIRRRMLGIKHDPEDGPEPMECPSCGEIEAIDEDYSLCARCAKRMEMHANDPPPEDDEPGDQDATPLIEGDDPDEFISDPPGCES